MSTNTDIIIDTQLFVNNPVAIQRAILTRMEEDSAGVVRVVDPTNPFAFMLDAMASVAVGGLMQAEVLTRKQYASVANSPEELYLHMADADYAERFSSPSKATISIYLGYDEIVQTAVTDPAQFGVRRLTLPKHTVITVADLHFTFQYPIDIRVMQHGGVSVSYNIDKPSPLYRPETEQVKWGVVVLEGLRYLRMDVPLQQMRLQPHFIKLDATTGFQKQYTYSDLFYYARAFMQVQDGSWLELRTTHTDQVYDPYTPTVVLQVFEGVLRAVIPQLYFNLGLVTDQIRLDIYTTKGPIELGLSNYDVTNFGAKWVDYDLSDNNVFTAPLNRFASLVIFSDSDLQGGGVGLTFRDLRDRVILYRRTNAGTPITQLNVTRELKALGYDVSTSLDNITDRQLIATKGVPQPSATGLISPMGTTVGMCEFRISDIASYDTVYDNGARVTISPRALFRQVAGKLSLLNSEERGQIANSDPAVISGLVGAQQYLYSPYFYVLETKNEAFTVRPYRLDRPTIQHKYLFLDNPSTQVVVNTEQYAIAVDEVGGGYTLVILASADNVYTALGASRTGVQLSVTHRNARYVIEGVLVAPVDPATDQPLDGQYLYRFDISTMFDINDAHELMLTPERFPIPLATEFDLIYYAKNHLPDGYEYTEMDTILDRRKMVGVSTTDFIIGIMHEKLSVRFGVFMERLWVRCRSVADSIQYVTYSEDVLAIYTEDVLERDSDGNIVFTYNDTSGEYEYQLLHRRGDPVLDATGVQVIAHRRGDTRLNDFGAPIPVGGSRGVLRQVDFVLLDGVHYFANDDLSLRYRDRVVDAITTWATEELDSVGDRLLDRTGLYFYPKCTVGEIDVQVGDGTTARIAAGQSLLVTVYQTSLKSRVPELKAAITTKVVRTVIAALDESVVSATLLCARIKSSIGDDALSVDVHGFADGRFNTLTLPSSISRLGLAKRLVVLSNLTLQVQDDIVVEFKVMA